jgi:hypothetical protein
MALPVTITGIDTAVNPVGPFRSSAGNYYFFGKDSTTATTLQAFKSTAPTSSWSSAATKTGFTTGVQAISGFQVADVIHLAVTDGATTSVNFKYVTYNMSTDAFGTTETITSALNTQTNGLVNAYGNSIAVRSDGTVVVLHQGARVVSMSNSYSRTVYSRRATNGTWTANIAVDAGGAFDGLVFDTAVGTSDNVHFMFMAGSGTFSQRTLSSANVLQTQSTAINGVSFTGSILGTSVSYLSTNQRVVFGVTTQVQQTNFIPAGFYFDSGNTPTLTSTVGGGTNTSTSRLFQYNGTVYHLWNVTGNNANINLHTSADNGATYVSSSVVYTGTSTCSLFSHDGAVYQSGSNIVVPYLILDNGTLKYNEYTVQYGLAASITEANDTVSSTANPKITANNPGGVAFTQQAAPSAGTKSWQAVASSTTGSTVWAAVYGGGIYKSTDYGATWAQRVGAANFQDICSSANGQVVAAVDNNVGNIWSTTDGVNFTARTGAGSRAWWAIACSSDGSRMVAVINGTGYTYTSSDSGVTWTEQTAAGTKNINALAMSSDGSIVYACYGASPYRIYKSTDYGVNWTLLSNSPTSWCNAITCSADGTQIYATVGGGNIYASTDSGSTWNALSGAGTANWGMISCSSSGTKVIAASYSNSVLTSIDSGATWTTNPVGSSTWQDVGISPDGSTWFALAYGSYFYTGALSAPKQIVAIQPTSFGAANFGDITADTGLGQTFIPRYLVPGLIQTSTINGGLVFGFNSTFKGLAQAITPATNSTVDRITFNMYKTGTPTDNVWVELRDNTGASIIATSNTVAGSSINSGSSSSQDIQFTFASPPTLNAGTTYILLVQRSGAVDSSNYYSINADYTNPYAGGDSYSWNGSAYTLNGGQDLAFAVYSTSTATVVISDITLKLIKNGSPTDNLTIELRDSTGATLLGTSDAIAGASTSSSTTATTFTFSTPVSITAGTTYMFVLRRSGAVDASNYWGVVRNNQNPYLDGAAYTYNGSTYTVISTPTDLVFTVNSPIQNIGNITEADDTVSAVGTQVAFDRNAVVAATEANDTVSSTSTLATHAAASITEADDTSSSASTITLKANASITEANDTVSSTSAIAIKAASTVTEANDTVSAIVQLTPIAGVASITEADDSVSSTSTNLTHGNASITEAGDTSTSASTLSLKSVATITEADDTVSSTSAIAIKAVSTVTEANDTIVSASAIAIKANASVTEANDTISSTSTLVIKATSASVISQTDDSQSVGIGRDTSTQSINQTIIPPANINLNSITLEISKIVAPTDDWFVEVRSGDGATLIATSNAFNASSIVSGFNTFTFASPVALTGGTTYMLRLRRTTLNFSNYLIVWYSYPSLYPYGEAYIYDGSNYNLLDGDLYFKLNTVGVIIESNDTVSSTTTIAIKGSASNTEAGDTVSSTAKLLIYANLSKGYYQTNSGDLNFNWSGGSAVSGDKSIMLAAAWEDTVGYPWISTDRGNSWTELNSNGLPSANYQQGSVASSYDGNLLVAVANNSDVYISTNRGVTWTLSVSYTSVTGLEISADGSTIYVSPNSGVYVSTNSGATWNAGTGISGAFRGVSCSSNGVIAYVYSGTQLWKTIDSGATWTQNTTIDALVDANSLVCSDDGLFVGVIDEPSWPNANYNRSFDGGVTWTTSSPFSHGFKIGASQDGSIQYALGAIGADPATLITSIDYGVTWTGVGTPIGNITNYQMSVSADGRFMFFLNDDDWTFYAYDLVSPITEADDTVSSTSVLAIKATTDSVTGAVNVLLANDNGFSWVYPLVSGDGSVFMVMASSAPWASYDRGATWAALTGAPNLQWNVGGSSYDGNVIIGGAWASTTHLYKSTDKGATWTGIPATLTNASHGGTWSAIGVSGDGNVIVAGEAGTTNIILSNNGGTSWTQKTGFGGDSTWKGNDFALSNDGSIIYATFLKGDITTGKLYKSTDSGATWSELTSAGTHAWAEVACSSNGSYVTVTAYGSLAYRSSDGGSTWTQITDAATNVYGVAVSSDGSIQYISANDSVIRSTNFGATWTQETGTDTPYNDYIAATADGSASLWINYDTYYLEGFQQISTHLVEQDDTISSTAVLINGVTANASITEANDTISSVAHNPIVGLVSNSEASDSVSSTATIQIKAVVTITEANDTAGSASVLPIKGAESNAEADDTISSTAILLLKAASTVTEANDTSTSTAVITIKANASNTEANDSISSTSVLPNKAASAVTETDDSISSTSVLPIKAVAIVTEADDIESSVAHNPIVGTASDTEADDAISFTGVLPIKATSGVTEANDTVSSTSTILIKAAASITEANDSIASTAILPILAVSNNTEANDSISSTSSAPVLAVLNSVEANDSVNFASVITLKANASITEEDDSLSASAVKFNPGEAVANITEDDDTVNSTSFITLKGALAVTELSDTSSSTATLKIVAASANSEASDTISSTSALLVKANASNAEANDSVASTSIVQIRAAASITEASDIVSSDTQSSIFATVNVIEDDDIASISSRLSINSSADLFEDDDIVSSTANVDVVAGETTVEDDDIILAIGELVIQAVSENVDDDDTIASIGKLLILATSDIIEENDHVDAQNQRFGTWITAETSKNPKTVKTLYYADIL